jgi:hypothetical protein
VLRAPDVQYRLLTARGIGWPLAICAGARATVPLFGGLSLPVLGRAPVPPAGPTSPSRITEEVYVSNVARGCRWPPSSDPGVQIADCGDESDSGRVVFRDGRATE